MKKVVMLAVVLSSALTGNYALSAEAKKEFYLLASYGKADAEEDDFDGNDSAFKIGAGMVLKDHIAVEAYYADYGEPDDSFPTNIVGVDLEASTQISAFVLQGVGTYALTNEFDVFGRVGFAKWTAETELRIPEAQFKESDDDDGFDLIYGLGAAYKLSPQISVRAEWERSEFDDLEVTMYSAGITYKLQ